ncbi:MAG: hypothetical protein ACREXK_13290 [Gammaproteobacteria bacterium]
MSGRPAPPQGAELGRDGELLTAVEDAGRVLLRRHAECVDVLMRR